MNPIQKNQVVGSRGGSLLKISHNNVGSIILLLKFAYYDAIGSRIYVLRIVMGNGICLELRLYRSRVELVLTEKHWITEINNYEKALHPTNIDFLLCFINGSAVLFCTKIQFNKMAI